MRTNSLALACGLLLFQISCGGPDINTERSGDAGLDIDFDAGVSTGGDDDAAAGAGCPSGVPKVGENCGPGTDESTSCTFTVNECLAPNGMTYDETETYCCPEGVWEKCSSVSPCDNFPDAAEPPPPPADAGLGDAVGDGPDGGNDTAGADSAAD